MLKIGPKSWFTLFLKARLTKFAILISLSRDLSLKLNTNIEVKGDDYIIFILIGRLIKVNIKIKRLPFRLRT